MKRFSVFFCLLLAILVGGVNSAYADDFAPTDGAVYLIKNKGNNQYALWNSNCVKGDNKQGIDAASVILSLWSQYDYRSAFIIEGNATNGYTIRSAKDKTLYVYAINTNTADGSGSNSGEGNVGLKSITDGTTVGEDCIWTISSNNGGWNIIPKNGTGSWNPRGSNGGNSHVGMWHNNDNANNIWLFEDLGEKVKDLAESMTNGVATGTGIGQVDAKATENIKSLASTFYSTHSEANYTAFSTAYSTGLAPYVYLESGYYRIKNADNSSSNSTFGSYLFSDIKHTYGQNHDKTLGCVPLDAEKNQNKYVWKITRGNLPAAQAQILNGQGVGINMGSYLTSINMGLSNYSGDGLIYFSNGFHLTNQPAYNVNGVKISTDLSDEEAAEQTRKNPMFLTHWNHSDAKGSNFIFEPIDVTNDYTVYNVAITGGDANCYVTYSQTGEVAKNGGFFLISKNEVPTVSDFESKYDVFDATITISNNTITVSYNKPNYERTMALAEVVIAKKGVGYPTEEAAVRATMNQAIQTAQASSHDYDDAQTLYTAINTYRANTNEIQMPEDGNAYTMTVVTKGGVKRYLNYAGKEAGYQMVNTTAEGNSDYPVTAKLICHKQADGSYVFLNNDGKYLIIPVSDSGASPQGKGYSETYVQSISKTDNGVTTTNERAVARLEVKPVAKNGHINVEQKDLFGYMYLQGYRNESYINNGVLIVKDNNGNFDKTKEAYFDGSYSSAILIEEVTYPNLITFNSTEGAVTGADYVATFSAPFATLLPDGVKAYYGKKSDDGTKVVLTEVEGEAVPANQGVILTSTSGTKVYMTPAAGETPATIEGNALGNSAGVAKDLEAGKAYILGKGSKGVAFYKSAAGTLPMNRAYLKNESGVNVSSIQMVFGETVDGIEDAVVMEGKDAPIYDLTGRRVLKAVKGGVYIQNGQKFIVK